MTIKCKICDKEFKSIITQTHLKTHGVSTAEYKAKFGNDSLSSEEYREKRKTKMLGKNNPMFGKSHSSETKDKISKKKSGTSFNKPEDFDEKMALVAKSRKPRKKGYRRSSPSVETRKKISKSVVDYAKNNPDEMKERGIKAYDSAVRNNNYLNINERFKQLDPERYKQHRERSRDYIQHANEIRSQKLSERSKKIAQSNNLIILEEFKTNSNINVYLLECDKCKSRFQYTRQFFTPSKEQTNYCPTCYPRDYKTSDAENELAEFIESLGVRIERNVRSLIPPLEIDIFLPDHNLGIEYDGLYWHSQSVLESQGNDPLKSNVKRKQMINRGKALIVVFEDEWKKSPEIVKSVIKSKISSHNRRIYGRQCSIQSVTTSQAKEFVNEHHLRGYNRCSVRYGLYYKNELVSVMTFSKSNVSRKSTDWEIDRFCSAKGVSVVGGASKLFKKFINDKNPTKVISYADLRWGDGDVYSKLGFRKISTTVPNYWYFMPNELKRYHRFSLRKNAKDDTSQTEYENRLQEGWLRIWDCGNNKWEWNNK